MKSLQSVTFFIRKNCNHLVNPSKVGIWGMICDVVHPPSFLHPIENVLKQLESLIFESINKTS